MSGDETKPDGNEMAPRAVLVCINRRFRGDQPSCAARGSEALADAIAAGIAARNIRVKLERSICMEQCTKGPTVRFAPGGRFNLGTNLEDVPILLDELEALCGVADDDDGVPMHLLGS
jgi:NADH:ubiquinone oxidoreductase subunit E